jgi:phosphatidylethanolamine-binding protein (PEBP) family uncharacterized protein
VKDDRDRKVIVPGSGDNMRPFLLAVLCAAAGLAGCGGSDSRSTLGLRPQTPLIQSPSKSSTTTGASSSPQTVGSIEPLPKVTINVTVPGLLQGGFMAAGYTCDRGNISLPVRWNGIPHGTVELALFVLGFEPMHGGLFFDWAVAGLRPQLHGVISGKLPPGAVVGRNSLGQEDYSICPPKGTRESYAVKVLALPHKIVAQPGFDALTFYRDAERSAKVVGLAGVTYKRP